MKEESRFNAGRTRALLLFDRVSWSAIIAGVVMAVAIQLALSVLGVGIGAATVNPQTEQSPLSGLGIGTGIWLLVSSIIAMFIGGWVSGRFSGSPHRSSGTLHGAVTWAVSVLAVLVLLTGAASSLLSGTASLISGVVTTTTQAAATSPELSQEIRDALRQSGIDIGSITEEAQQPQTQAQAEQTARDTGEKVAGGLSMAGIFGFIGLMIGLISAALGGRVGVPKDIAITDTAIDRAA